MKLIRAEQERMSLQIENENLSQILALALSLGGVSEAEVIAKLEEKNWKILQLEKKLQNSGFCKNCK